MSTHKKTLKQKPSYHQEIYAKNAVIDEAKSISQRPHNNILNFIDLSREYKGELNPSEEIKKEKSIIR